MKAVLLDRDGTVVIEPPSRDVIMETFELFPDTLEALKKLAEAGFAAIFVTNQTGIADRGLSIEEYHETNKKMLDLIKPTGIEVLNIYLCPHGVNDACECRKPQPGMLKQAQAEFNLDMANTYMVGDNVTDVEAGINAGTKTILLRQGINKTETDKADYIADNLSEAVEYIATH